MSSAGCRSTTSVLAKRDTPPQEEFDNSAFQAANALQALHRCGDVAQGPLLLVDTLTRSGWTLTVATVLLAEQGAGPVLPLVLQSAVAG